MSLRIKVVALMGALLLSLAAAREVQAADQQALIDQISALTKSAFSAYGDGDLDKAKSQLLQAVALGKKDGELASHPLMARTYLLLGVVYVDGFDDRKKGGVNFGKALKISPDIQIPETLATKTVKKAFTDAGGSTSAKAAVASEPGGSDTGTAARTEKEDKRKATRDDKESDEADRDTEDDRDRDKEALVQAKSSAAKARAEKERLLKEREEKDGQISQAKSVLSETKQRLQQLEKDKADKDKQIAAGNDREKKEREAKDKLEKEKVERDRVLADLKQQLQQATKDKADKDKLIAAGTDREKKEREAKEKLEKEKQASDAREKERMAQEETVRTDREKLASGPDLPGHVSEQIYCALPDEAQSGKDLFVHCTAQEGIKAKEIAFYYRPSGIAHYNSLVMERSKKGWYTAMIPATQVRGKLLQYYIEGRDGRDAVTATNGKAQSPNILTLRTQGGGLVAGGDMRPAATEASFTPASSTNAKRSGRTPRDKGR